MNAAGELMTGTQPAAKAADDLDASAILGAIGVSRVASTQRIRGGWDTAIWQVRCDAALPGVRSTTSAPVSTRADSLASAPVSVPISAGATVSRHYALRLFRREQATVCRREVAAMLTARAGGVPVPEVYLQGQWQQRPALLLEWCQGTTVLAALQAAPWQVVHLGGLLGRAQAQIHAVSAPPSLQAAPDWISWCGPDEAVLQEHLRRQMLRSDALLHLDFHPLNVLCEGGRLSAVLDWANALAGDPRADLARTLTLLRVSPGETGLPAALVWLLRWLLAVGWWSGYRQTAGRHFRDQEMAPFYAWAGAVMVRDLQAKIGRPGIWLQHHHLDPARRWTAYWKRRCGLASSEAASTGT